MAGCPGHPLASHKAGRGHNRKIRMRPAADGLPRRHRAVRAPSREVLLGERLVQEMHVGVEAPLMHDGVARIAGGEQHRNWGVYLLILSASTRPLKSPRTTSVNSRSIRVFLASTRRPRHRRPRRPRSRARGDAPGIFEDVGIVLHHQDHFVRLGARWPARHPCCRPARRRPLGADEERQVELHRGAVAEPRYRCDMAPDCLTKPCTSPAQAQTPCPPLGREERIENLVEDLGGDSGPGVGDTENHVLARLDVAEPAYVSVVEIGVCRLDGEAAAVGMAALAFSARLSSTFSS